MVKTNKFYRRIISNMSNAIVDVTKMKTVRIMKKRFIESSVKNLDSVRRKRILLTIKMGSQYSQQDASERVKLIHGHRAMIGNFYRIIRESTNFTLDSLADRCSMSAEELREYEEEGFMEEFDDKISMGMWYWIGFTLRIYVEWLKNGLVLAGNNSNEVAFEDILDFTDATITDINQELSYSNEFDDEVFIIALKEIKASYQIINEILEPYRLY